MRIFVFYYQTSCFNQVVTEDNSYLKVGVTRESTFPCTVFPQQPFPAHWHVWPKESHSCHNLDLALIMFKYSKYRRHLQIMLKYSKSKGMFKKTCPVFKSYTTVQDSEDLNNELVWVIAFLRVLSKCKDLTKIININILTDVFSSKCWKTNIKRSTSLKG